jgi:hypothetical protein
VRPLLTDTDRVVLTLVYLRQHCSQKVLAELLEINPHLWCAKTRCEALTRCFSDLVRLRAGTR